MGRLRAGGAEIDPADLAHVWPLQHARIIPNGTHFLGWPQSKTPDMASARRRQELTVDLRTDAASGPASWSQRPDQISAGRCAWRSQARGSYASEIAIVEVASRTLYGPPFGGQIPHRADLGSKNR